MWKAHQLQSVYVCAPFGHPQSLRPAVGTGRAWLADTAQAGGKMVNTPSGLSHRNHGLTWAYCRMTHKNHKIRQVLLKHFCLSRVFSGKRTIPADSSLPAPCWFPKQHRNQNLSSAWQSEGPPCVMLFRLPASTFLCMLCDAPSRFKCLQ